MKPQELVIRWEKTSPRIEFAGYHYRYAGSGHIEGKGTAYFYIPVRVTSNSKVYKP